MNGEISIAEKTGKNCLFNEYEKDRGASKEGNKMSLLIIIGVILAVYGGISLKFPKKLNKNRSASENKEGKYLTWYLTISVFGGVVALVAGILLIIAGIILY